MWYDAPCVWYTMSYTIHGRYQYGISQVCMVYHRFLWYITSRWSPPRSWFKSTPVLARAGHWYTVTVDRGCKDRENISSDWFPKNLNFKFVFTINWLLSMAQCRNEAFKAKLRNAKAYQLETSSFAIFQIISNFFRSKRPRLPVSKIRSACVCHEFTLFENWNWVHLLKCWAFREFQNFAQGQIWYLLLDHDPDAC